MKDVHRPQEQCSLLRRLLSPVSHSSPTSLFYYLSSFLLPRSRANPDNLVAVTCSFLGEGDIPKHLRIEEAGEDVEMEDKQQGLAASSSLFHNHRVQAWLAKEHREEQEQEQEMSFRSRLFRAWWTWDSLAIKLKQPCEEPTATRSSRLLFSSDRTRGGRAAHAGGHWRRGRPSKCAE